MDALDLTETLDALRADPDTAAVKFYGMGLHAHLTYHMGFFEMQVHTAPGEDGEEGVVAELWPLEPEEVAAHIGVLEAADRIILTTQHHLLHALGVLSTDETN